MDENQVLKRFSVALDVARSTSNREFTVVDGDSGNVLVITLKDDGTPVDLTGCRVVAAFSKSDGTAAQDSATTDGGITIGGDDGNEVTISLFSGSTAPGIVECELQVFSGADQKKLVTSAKFNFKCRRGILDEKTVAAANEYPFLVSLIDKCETIETAETARAASESEREAAEDVRSALYRTVLNAYQSGALRGEKGDTAGNAVFLDAETDISGLLKGDGETVSAATAGSDYLAPPIVAQNRVASGFVSDTTYADFPYKAVIAITGVAETMRPEVIFAPADAASGSFAAVAACVAGGVAIYSKSDAAVSVPTVIVWR